MVSNRFAAQNAKDRRAQRRSTFLMAVLVVVLVTMCYISVQGPVSYDRQRARRERVIKQHLQQVRSAQQAYCRVTGHYSASIDTLVRQGYLNSSLRHIPFSHQQTWHLTVKTITTATGQQRNAIECGATYADYLSDLDAALTSNLTATATASDRYPGLRFGDQQKPDYTDFNW